MAPLVDTALEPFTVEQIGPGAGRRADGIGGALAGCRRGQSHLHRVAVHKRQWLGEDKRAGVIDGLDGLDHSGMSPQRQERTREEANRSNLAWIAARRHDHPSSAAGGNSGSMRQRSPPLSTVRY